MTAFVVGLIEASGHAMAPTIFFEGACAGGAVSPKTPASLKCTTTSPVTTEKILPGDFLGDSWKCSQIQLACERVSKISNGVNRCGRLQPPSPPSAPPSSAAAVVRCR